VTQPEQRWSSSTGVAKPSPHLGQRGWDKNFIFDKQLGQGRSSRVSSKVCPQSKHFGGKTKLTSARQREIMKKLSAISDQLSAKNMIDGPRNL